MSTHIIHAMPFITRSLIAEWLEQASQWHEVCCHDLEVMSSNPSWVELRVRNTSVLSRTWTKKYKVSSFLVLKLGFYNILVLQGLNLLHYSFLLIQDWKEHHQTVVFGIEQQLHESILEQSRLQAELVTIIQEKEILEGHLDTVTRAKEDITRHFIHENQMLRDRLAAAESATCCCVVS